MTTARKVVKKHAIFTKDNDKFVLVLRIKDKDFYPKNEGINFLKCGALCTAPVQAL